MRSKARSISVERTNPGGFPSVDQVDCLRDAIARIGGARWTIAATFTCEMDFAEAWSEAVGPLGDVLVLAERVESPSATNSSRTLVALPCCGIHGKVLVARGPGGTAVQIGSANLTSGGLGGGARDIVWTQVVTRELGPRALLMDVCSWLSGRLDAARFRTPYHDEWKDRLSDLRSLLEPEPEPRPAFFSNDAQPLIAALREVSKGPIGPTTIFSPWVHSEALASMCHQRTVVVIPSGNARDQGQLQGDKDWWRKHQSSVRVLAEDDGVSTHAKIYLLRGGEKSWLFFGSANCTVSGLLRRAGEKVGNQPALAEVLVGIPLTRTEATRLERALRNDLAAPKELPEVVECGAEETDGGILLVAWATRLDGTLFLSLAQGIEAPDSDQPVLKRGRETIRYLGPRLEDSGGCLTFRPNAQEWSSAVHASEDGWQVCWGAMMADVWFIDAAQPHDDVVQLWGGHVREAMGVGLRDPRQSRSPTSRSGALLARAPLDEFEQRSLRVAEALEEDLLSPMPERAGLFRELWRDRSDLGIPEVREDEIRGGARLFLATRMLAILDRHGKTLAAPYRSLRDDLTRELPSLVGCFSEGDEEEFLMPNKGWRHPKMWPTTRDR